MGSHPKKPSENVNDQVRDDYQKKAQEKCLLEDKLTHHRKLISENKTEVKALIDKRSKEMKELLVLIDNTQDKTCAAVKQMDAVDCQIKELEEKVSILKEERLRIKTDVEINNKALKKLNNKKYKLESCIETEMSKSKEMENKLVQDIRQIEEKIATIDTFNPREEETGTTSKNDREKKNAKQMLIDFLGNTIKEKENDLECPV